MSGLGPQPLSPLPHALRLPAQNRPQPGFPFPSSPPVGRAAGSGNHAIFWEAMTTSLQRVQRGGGGQKPMHFRNLSEAYAERVKTTTTTTKNDQNKKPHLYVKTNSRWEASPPLMKTSRSHAHLLPWTPPSGLFLDTYNLTGSKGNQFPCNISTYRSPDFTECHRRNSNGDLPSAEGPQHAR